MDTIWCQGPLLEYIQLSGTFEDDKYFVDLPIASQAFRHRVLQIVNTEDHQSIRKYRLADLLECFAQEPSCSGEDKHIPGDFKHVPDVFLPHVTEREVRLWALFIHGQWAELCRKGASNASQLSTQLPMSSYFFVPGQRFREVYYWDTYWVVKGLLVSGMLESAKVVVRNLIDLLEAHGFVPNGSRLYYLNRSQPPLLSHMVAAIYEAEHTVAWLQAAFPALELEHKHWTSAPKQLSVRVATDPTEAVHQLSRYYADTEQPRPEGYRKDVEAAAGLSRTEARRKYREIASTAESGWDFSTRWGPSTTHVIPTDLNCFLLMMERNMQRFAQELGQDEKAQEYGMVASRREAAITALMSVPGRPGVWTDLVIDDAGLLSTGDESVHKVRQRSCPGSYASDYLPVWAGLASSPEAAVAGLRFMHKSGLVCEGGIATSDKKGTGNQWDGSNAWPPLQAMVIEGLHKHGGAQGQEWAAVLAQLWLSSSYRGWLKYGEMFEKMDAERPGEPGGEGEYQVQTGFGWSNGVVLQLLATYGWHPESRYGPRPWVCTGTGMTRRMSEV